MAAKVVALLLALTMLASFSACEAAEGSQSKGPIAVTLLPLVNNSQSKYREDLETVFSSWRAERFPAAKYLIANAKDVEDLLKNDFTPSDMEREDLRKIGLRLNSEYVLYVELRPLGSVSHLAIMHAKRDASVSLLIRAVQVSTGEYVFKGLIADVDYTHQQSIPVPIGAGLAMIPVGSTSEKEAALGTLKKVLQGLGEKLTF